MPDSVSGDEGSGIPHRDEARGRNLHQRRRAIAWDAIDENTRARTIELVATTMKNRYVPLDFFAEAISILRTEVEATGEPLSGWRFKDIISQAVWREYERVQEMMYRGPMFDPALVHTPMRRLYLHSLSVGNEAQGRIAGSVVAMSADLVVLHNGGNVEHISSNFPMPANTIHRRYPKQGKTRKKNKPSGAKAGSGGGGGVCLPPFASPGLTTTRNAVITRHHNHR